MSFAIQPLRKICCTFTAAYVWGPGFVLVADLASKIQMIRLFHYHGDGLSLPCKRHFTTNVTKVICTIDKVMRHHYAGLTLLASLCSIYDAGINGCGVHDGPMQYDTIFWNLSTYFIFSRYIYLADDLVLMAKEETVLQGMIDKLKLEDAMVWKWMWKKQK